jgi:hypothetical protein
MLKFLYLINLFFLYQAFLEAGNLQPKGRSGGETDPGDFLPFIIFDVYRFRINHILTVRSGSFHTGSPQKAIIS